MKHFLKILTAVTALLICAAVFLPLSGPIADKVISAAASAATHESVKFEGVKIRHLSTAEFKKWEWHKNKAVIIEGGEGYFKWRGNRIYCHATEVLFHKESYRAASFAASWLESVYGPSVRVASMDALYTFSLNKTTLRVYEFDSEHFKIHGSILREKGAIDKAFLTLSVPSKVFDRLPKEAQKRAISNGNWSQWRLLYNNRLLTLVGKTGPFFKMTWQAGKN